MLAMTGRASLSIAARSSSPICARRLQIQRPLHVRIEAIPSALRPLENAFAKVKIGTESDQIETTLRRIERGVEEGEEDDDDGDEDEDDDGDDGDEDEDEDDDDDDEDYSSEISELEEGEDGEEIDEEALENELVADDD